MATTPVTPAPTTRQPRAKKAVAAAKHTITLSFEGKFASLYDVLVEKAEADDRTVSQFVLLALRDSFPVIETN